MYKNIIKSTIIATILALPTLSIAKNIKVCVDNDWFPYSFMKDDQVVGIHIDIVRKAIQDNGDSVTFKAIPWKRCLSLGKVGKVDGMMSASYKDKRAVFAYYPKGAKTEKRVQGRIDQIEYMLVTKKTNDYVYNGEYKTIPQPISIGAGASLKDNLSKAGLKVKESRTNKNSISMLMLNRVNSVALNPIRAKAFNTNGEFKNKLTIHKIPLKGKSYHIIFSKKSKIDEKDRKKVWDSLDNVRTDEKFLFEIFSKYTK